MARPSLQSRADEAIGLLALLYGYSEISGLLGGLSVLSEGTACPLEAMLARVRAELTAEIPGLWDQARIDGRRIGVPPSSATSRGADLTDP